MQLAIVCSWLNQYGGAERVLEVVHDMYPQAPIYTSIYAPAAFPERYRSWDIRPSFMNHLPFIKRKHQLYLPLYPLGFESLDLRDYDLVLSLTSAFAHGVITSPETQHVCYCLTPARFLWNYHGYIEREGLGHAARWLLLPYLKSLRQWDRLAADRVDQFIAISHTVQRRIRKYYQREAQIIYPPLRSTAVIAEGRPEDYFLVVSRLVPYKRIDLAVRAFNVLGLPLRIIGDGRDRKALEAIARPNIRFLGYLPDAEVQSQMAHCRAFLFPGEEDFGLTPLEAMSAGRPVIAYGAGGALDTIEEGRTGLFFGQPTPESLVEAVKRLDLYTFDPPYLRQSAHRFDEAVFRKQLAHTLDHAG